MTGPYTSRISRNPLSLKEGIMVSAIGKYVSSFLENPRSFLNKKTIAVSLGTGIALLVVSRLAQYIAERGKPNIKAVIYQKCLGLKTYNEVDKILESATPHVSRLWGHSYITAPGYQGRCYLEDLAARVVVWDAEYFSRSTQKNQESPVGQAIVEKICRFYDDVYKQMDDVKFPMSGLYLMFTVERCCRDHFSKLDHVTLEGHGSNPDLFKI